jgi:hypothetical protein
MADAVIEAYFSSLADNFTRLLVVHYARSYGPGEKQIAVHLRVPTSTQISLGRLPSKIGGKCPVDYCGVALTGEVGFPPNSLDPAWRYVPGRAGKLLGRFLHLLPCTPPAEHCSQFWPSGHKCLDKLGAQSCDR